MTDRKIVTAVGSPYLSFPEEVLRHLDERPAIEPLTYFREPSLFPRTTWGWQPQGLPELRPRPPTPPGDPRP